MHFPGSDRTLEAYATWFAAVFASAALFWAWKAFSVQSQMLEAQLDTLREQQRGIFLSSLSKEYNKRLENAAFWIVMEVKEKFPHNTGEKLYLTSQQKLIYYFGMIIARKNVEEIREVNNSQNVRAYEAIARDYDQQIDRQRLEILKKGSMPDCAWVQVLVHIKNKESVYQAMASNF